MDFPKVSIDRVERDAAIQISVLARCSRSPLARSINFLRERSPGLGTVTDAIGGIIDVGCSLDPFCDSSGPSSSVDICLSDGVKLLLDKTFERSPLVALESMGPVAVPQPCIEGGEPTTTDYASASCKCVPAKRTQMV